MKDECLKELNWIFMVLFVIMLCQCSSCQSLDSIDKKLDHITTK